MKTYDEKIVLRISASTAEIEEAKAKASLLASQGKSVWVGFDEPFTFIFNQPHVIEIGSDDGVIGWAYSPSAQGDAR